MDLFKTTRINDDYHYGIPDVSKETGSKLVI